MCHVSYCGEYLVCRLSFMATPSVFLRFLLIFTVTDVITIALLRRGKQITGNIRFDFRKKDVKCYNNSDCGQNLIGVPEMPVIKKHTIFIPNLIKYEGNET